MTRDYERERRAESRWLRFVARQARDDARRARERLERALAEARRLCGPDARQR